MKPRQLFNYLPLSMLLGSMIVISGVVLRADDMPTVGHSAPSFALNSQEGKRVSLEDFRGKWVVLYFYPKDMTSGCTLEAHNFQRDLTLYVKRNAVIVGVSVDNLESHQEFCTKESLTLKLLSDTDHAVTSSYGSLAHFGDTVVAARNTFLVDPKGTIRKIYTKVNPGRHSEEVLAALAELQGGAEVQ
jgi:peroxiredoxin Q/BCP